jgi:hypothetical protein
LTNRAAEIWRAKRFGAPVLQAGDNGAGAFDDPDISFRPRRRRQSAGWT